jgi:hypothetical protein
MLLFIGLYFIHQQIYSYVKHVFNAWYLCLNCMNLWINELHMVFIINSSQAKFVIIKYPIPIMSLTFSVCPPN